MRLGGGAPRGGGCAKLAHADRRPAGILGRRPASRTGCLGETPVAEVAGRREGRVAMAKEGPPDVPEIDLDACGLDALIGWLLALDGSAIRLLADEAPRRIPPKQRRRRDTFEQALTALWAHDEGRRHLLSAMRSTMSKLTEEIREGGLAAAADLAQDFPPNSLLWYAAEAGLDPSHVLERLPDTAREAFATRQATLREYAEHLRRFRQHKLEAGAEAQRRTATQEAARMTRALRWQAEQAQEKLIQTQRATERVARERAEEVRRLERALAEAERRIAEQEAEIRDLRQQIADISRDFAGRAAQRGAPPQGQAPDAAPALALEGQTVLVVGDENRQVAYRETVEAMGGRFEFVSGFGNPAELRAKARAATVIVFVTAYAGHKMWVQARSAEQSGVALVPVPQAGAQSFRAALRAWADAQRREGAAH